MSRPLTITPYGAVTISTSQSQIGGASGFFDGGGLLVGTPPPAAFGSGNFTVEFWIRPTSVPQTGFIILNEMPGFDTYFIRIQPDRAIAFVNRLANSNEVVVNNADPVTLNQWTHIAFTRSGSTFRVFSNGVLQRSNSLTTNYTVDTTKNMNIGNNGDAGFSNSPIRGFLDELRISNVARYTSTFTPSTQAFVNDNNTLFLMHFDGANNSTVFLDDATPPPIEASANLSTTSQLVVQPSKTVNVNVNKTLQSTLSVSPSKTTDVSGLLDSEFSKQTSANVTSSAQAELESRFTVLITAAIVTTDQFYIEPGYIDEGYFVYIADGRSAKVVETTLTASIGVIKSSAVEMAAEFTTTAVLSHIFGADMFAFSESELAVLVQRIRDNNIDLESVFDVGVDYIRIIQALINADSEFDIDIATIRQRNAASALEAAFSIDVDVQVIPPTIIILESEAFLTVDADKIINATADLNSNSTLAADIGIIRQIDADLITEFDLTSDVSAVRDAAADLSAETHIEVAFNNVITAEAMFTSITSKLVIAVKIVDKDIDLFAVTDIDVVGEKTVDVLANLISDFDIVINAEIVKNANANLESISDLEIQVLKISDGIAEITAESELLVLAGTLLDSGPIVFESITAKLTVGRLVNLDMKIYQIPAETRIHIIDRETRIHRISEETRIFAIRRTQ